MKIWAVTMVKDEADVIVGVLRHMADELAETDSGILVADNGSTDGTRDCLRALRGSLSSDCLPVPLEIIDDPDPAYYQSRKMSALAETAHREHGAEWIVPFDADELWVASDRVGVIIERVESEVGTVRVLGADLTHHFRTSIDVDDHDPFRSMVWRQPAPTRLPKVAFRYEDGITIDAGNHGVTRANGERLQSHDGLLHIRHFPYRSEDHFVRKAVNGSRAYKAATGLPFDTGAHWRQYGEILERHGEAALRGVYREHFFYAAPVEGGLIRDPGPYMRWRP